MDLLPMEQLTGKAWQGTGELHIVRGLFVPLTMWRWSSGGHSPVMEAAGAFIHFPLHLVRAGGCSTYSKRFT